MAYFSNGTEGYSWQEVNCDKCALWKSRGDEDPDNKGCPINDVQMLYNYDQLAGGQEKLRSAMRILIPEDQVLIDGKPAYRVAKQCSMFEAKDG